MTKDEIDPIDHEEDAPHNRWFIKISKLIVKLTIAAMMYACWSGLLPDYFNSMLLASFIACAWVTYRELREDNFITMIFSLSGTILLNPLYPVYFNVQMQYATYLILAIGFFGSAIFDLFKAAPNHEKTKFNK